ncbi:MAG TPA: hypothetical protein VM307_15255 [Egibacteraceae bacterium]|nr:hypothetical protein [Egibacteraceae bacterium]
MTETFAFRFDRRYAPLLRMFGATPQRCSLIIDDDRLAVRFGWFTLVTPRSNIASAEVTGPHQALKALGVRTSLSDRGLTFGSSADRTTCIRFHEPVRIRPVDVVAHPGLTVSVDRPDALATLLNKSTR